MIYHRRQQEVFGDYSRNWVGERAAPRIGIQKVQLRNQKLGRIRLRAVDDCSANLDASYQVLQELVLDLRGKIKRKEKVDPKEMEYLNQIDAELARRNLPDEPHHVHDVIKSLIMKTAIAAALLEVPGRIAEHQQELKGLRSEVGAINEELRKLKRDMSALAPSDPVRLELQSIETSKRKLLSNYKGRQRALEKELTFLSAPPEELQQRLENGERELTKLLGIGIPCEPVPKVVLAAFLPEANKPKAKPEAEASLVKSQKPEETLEDELKPKGFGLGLK